MRAKFGREGEDHVLHSAHATFEELFQHLSGNIM